MQPRCSCRLDMELMPNMMNVDGFQKNDAQAEGGERDSACAS